MRFWLFALILGASCAHAQSHDVRIGVGADFIQKPGMPMIALTARPFSLLAWNNDNFGAGLTYPFGGPRGWSGGLGGIVVRRTDEDVGTRLNVLARASYCWERVCLSYAHISHASALGIQPHAANSGLNFLFFEYRLK